MTSQRQQQRRIIIKERRGNFPTSFDVASASNRPPSMGNVDLTFVYIHKKILSIYLAGPCEMDIWPCALNRKGRSVSTRPGQQTVNEALGRVYIPTSAKKGFG